MRGEADMRSARSRSISVQAGRLIEATQGFQTAVCAACAAIYPYAAWASLALVQRIDSAEIAQLVRDWPSDVSIDVRRCARCGGSIARKSTNGPV
jgi:hypothetical protein